jgi:hypothetical protein
LRNQSQKDGPRAQAGHLDWWDDKVDPGPAEVEEVSGRIRAKPELGIKT